MQVKRLHSINRIVFIIGGIFIFLLGTALGILITHNKLVNDTGRKVYFYDPRNQGKFSTIQLEKEPDDTFNRANSLIPGYQTQGTFSTATDIDMYTFTLENPADVQINLYNSPNEYNLYVYDNNKFLVASSQRAGFSQSSSTISLQNPGKYFIKLVGKGQGKNNSNFPYSIMINILPLQE